MFKKFQSHLKNLQVTLKIPNNLLKSPCSPKILKTSLKSWQVILKNCQEIPKSIKKKLKVALKLPLIFIQFPICIKCPSHLKSNTIMFNNLQVVFKNSRGRPNKFLMCVQNYQVIYQVIFNNL